MDSQEKTFKNPIEEQRKAALEHYEQVSRAANHWSSFVESAIKAYNPESCPPPVSAEKLYTERDMGNLWQYVVDGAKNIMLGKPSGIGGFEDYIVTVSPVAPSPSAPVVAEDLYKKSLSAVDKILKEQPELIEKISNELDKFGFEGPTISEYFASFGHSPAERIEESDAVKVFKNLLNCQYEVVDGGLRREVVNVAAIKNEFLRLGIKEDQPF